MHQLQLVGIEAFKPRHVSWVKNSQFCSSSVVASLMSFKKHEVFLKDVFVIYASMDQTDENASNVSTINEVEFVKLIRDIGLMGGSLTEKSARNIFACVQAEEDNELTTIQENDNNKNNRRGSVSTGASGGENTTSEMVYTEFLEGIAALSALHNPDPFIPLAYRIVEYIQTVFKPACMKHVDMNLAKSKRKNIANIQT